MRSKSTRGYMPYTLPNDAATWTDTGIRSVGHHKVGKDLTTGSEVDKTWSAEWPSSPTQRRVLPRRRCTLHARRSFWKVKRTTARRPGASGPCESARHSLAVVPYKIQIFPHTQVVQRLPPRHGFAMFATPLRMPDRWATMVRVPHRQSTPSFDALAGV